MINVLHCSYSDCIGGAAKASLRIHDSLVRHESTQINSRVRVAIKHLPDKTIMGHNLPFGNSWGKVRSSTGAFLTKVLCRPVKNYISPCFLPSIIDHELNCRDVDIIHLHWINGEMMSVEAISRINKPIVWTMHDVWPFSGAQHHFSEVEYGDPDIAYDRTFTSEGLNANAFTWHRKRHHWSAKEFFLVSPSKWMAKLAMRSSLFQNSTIRTICNPLPDSAFISLSKTYARSQLCIPTDGFIVFLCAHGIFSDPNKGLNHFLDCLNHLVIDSSKLLVFVAGEFPIQTLNIHGFKIVCLGVIDDPSYLHIHYAASDIVVVPSEYENYPQVACEAHAAGRPVVAFRTTGCAEIIVHRETGYLAEPLDTVDLARGIEYCLQSLSMMEYMSSKAYARAELLWRGQSVAGNYRRLYRNIIGA